MLEMARDDASFVSPPIEFREKHFINLIKELPTIDFSLDDIDVIIYNYRSMGNDAKCIILHPEQMIRILKYTEKMQRYLESICYRNEKFTSCYRGIPLLVTHQDNLGICYKCNFPGIEIVIVGNKLMSTCSNHYTEALMLKKLELSR